MRDLFARELLFSKTLTGEGWDGKVGVTWSGVSTLVSLTP